MAAIDRPAEGNPSDASQPVWGHAGVVGAGIAGLSAAIALRHAGWHVEVFEKSQFKNETGAAITVTPNATLVLDRWGFDMGKACAVPNKSMTLSLASEPTNVLLHENYAGTATELGHGFWSLHRVDLHRGLRHLATEDTPSVDTDSEKIGPPVGIKLGCEVTGVDCEQGILKLANGQTITKDLVIVADGAHSTLICNFTGRPDNLRRTGHSIYRWLVDMDSVRAIPELREIFTRYTPGFITWRDPKTDVFWVTYRCRDDKVLNNAVVHETLPGEGGDSSWHSPVSNAQVYDTVKNFHNTIKTLVDLADHGGITTHHLYARPPLTSFVRGRTAVVGDAAHVMMPTHAAGGSISIESAATLEVLFRTVDGKGSGTIGQRLCLFDQLRIPRCNLTMLASNAGRAWLKVPGLVDEIRRFYSGPLPPPDEQAYSKAFIELLFAHDEYQTAEEMLAQMQSSSARNAPDGMR